MRWEKLEQHGAVPEPRSSHSLTWVDGKLYVFGGEHDPRVPVGSDVFAYDLATATWERLQGVTGEAPRCAFNI